MLKRIEKVMKEDSHKITGGSAIWGCAVAICGDASGIKGCVSHIKGDVSYISGDVSDIYGDVDEAVKEFREKNPYHTGYIDINDLVE